MSTEIGNQRVVERLDGSDLDERWTKIIHQGGMTWAMADVIDGGLEATTNTSQTRAELNFGGIHQYNFAGAKVIGIAKLDVAESTVAIGLDNNNFTGLQTLSGEGSNSQTFFQLTTRGPASTTGVSTTIPIDQAFHRFELELTATTATLTFDGLLEAISTTNLPTIKLQPFLGGANAVGGGTSRTVAYRYYEVLNT